MKRKSSKQRGQRGMSVRVAAMADQSCGQSRPRMWMKIAGLFLVIVTVINAVMILFYFDQGNTAANTQPRKPDCTTIRLGVSGGDHIKVDRSGSRQTADNSDRASMRSATNPNTVPLILWWDAVTEQTDEDVQCGRHRCHVTVDRNRWQEQEVMMMSFYGTSLSCHDLPLPRGEGHLWALYHDESPKNREFLFSHQAVMELFNYTATFRSHAHLSFPTQWLNDVKDVTSTHFVVPVSTKSQLRRTEHLAPVVYVQSDCRVPSDRDHFVTLLQQHVAVDSYGECMHNKDFPNGSSLIFVNDMSAMTAEEFYRVLARYKFGIAIENAVCPGYITEKFWRPLKLGVVPIVFGASNVKEFLPSENSALIVDDFDSVEKLAQAIHHYDSHDTEYSRLLQHKQTGITNSALLKHLQHRSQTSFYRTQMMNDYHCMLCEKLHEAIASRRSGRPIPRSVAGTDHYGCPKPGKFNDKGQYVTEVSGHWDVPWALSQVTACLMRTLIDNNTRMSLESFDELVRQQFKSGLDDKCLKYFS